MMKNLRKVGFDKDYISLIKRTLERIKLFIYVFIHLLLFFVFISILIFLADFKSIKCSFGRTFP